ncbi:MAG: hypothetical protein M3N68_08085 [Actinomycetota bacterium]|nr:hypothetical protein [Actinomycetota bacterium]
MAAIQQGGQLVGLDLSGQLHGGTAVAPPPSRRLVGVEVVVTGPRMVPSRRSWSAASPA